MPIFEYSCTQCNHEFEHIAKNKDEKPQCPQCSSKEVKKRISSPTILPMGGGPPAGSPFS